MIENSPASRAAKRLLDRLHARVIAGDLKALDEFCERVLKELRYQLAAKWPHEDRDLIDMSLDDALLKYARLPGRYDPSRGHPIAYIKKISVDRLFDLRRSRGRRLFHEVTADFDAIATSAFLAEPSSPTPERNMEVEEQRSLLISVAKNDPERVFVTAWYEGSTSAELAQILGLQDASNAKQQGAVHAIKERLRKRARLAAARLRSDCTEDQRRDRQTVKKKTSEWFQR